MGKSKICWPFSHRCPLPANQLRWTTTDDVGHDAHSSFWIPFKSLFLRCCGSAKVFSNYNSDLVLNVGTCGVAWRGAKKPATSDNLFGFCLWVVFFFNCTCMSVEKRKEVVIVHEEVGGSVCLLKRDLPTRWHDAWFEFVLHRDRRRRQRRHNRAVTCLSNPGAVQSRFFRTWIHCHSPPNLSLTHTHTHDDLCVLSLFFLCLTFKKG